MSLAKVTGLIYAILGLFIGIIIAFAVSLGALAGSMMNDSPSAVVGVIIGIGAIVLAPIFYGFLGFIGGLIVAGLYNWIVGFTGGIHFVFEEKEDMTSTVSAKLESPS